MHCLKSMAAEWLKQRGYHGLVSPGECGCSHAAHEEFMPCHRPGHDCEPAIEVIPPEDSGDDQFFTVAKWFDPKKTKPNIPGGRGFVDTWIRQKDGEQTHEQLRTFFSVFGWQGIDDHDITAWRYDLPPGSWREGEDQSKLPGVKK